MGITVIGLGPSNGRYLTRYAWQLLSSAKVVYLRTARHPAVEDLPAQVERVSFDPIYEQAEQFSDVYTAIVTELIKLAQEDDIIYAVPGHPFVGESTVLHLQKMAQEENIPVYIVDGLSFVEPTLTAVGLDALDGLQIFDAIELTQYHYPPLNPDVSALLGQVYSRLLASELKERLTAVYPDTHPVYLVHGAGSDDALVESLALYEIDRSPHVAHLTSLLIPPLPAPSSLNRLAETVAILRSPEGCPWDRQQTPQTMRSGLIEEMAELLTALDNDDVENVREELGDVLFHLVFQAQMAMEVEDFRLTESIAGIDEKLRRRHPHVWGTTEVATSDDVVLNWEEIKRAEKGENLPSSVLSNIPPTLSALTMSQKIQKKVAKVGFDWADLTGVYEKVQEELAEVQQAQTSDEQHDELGDLLFVVVNVAKWLGVDAETALRDANIKFTRRFQAVEQLATERGLNLSEIGLPALEALWQDVKEQE